jgi:TolB protein
MRRATGLVALCAALNVHTGSTAADVLTVAQRDVGRSHQDRASADVSADGRYVAFASYSRLAPADSNDARDIYVLDRSTGKVTLESVLANGQAIGADSNKADISGDGRYVVYESRLTPREEHVQIILRDRHNDSVRALSNGVAGTPANGPSRDPSISADGRTVVFASAATDLVAGPDENGSAEDVYAIDLPTGSLRRVSVRSDGSQPQAGSSFSPSLSGDGRYVAFTSSSALDPAVRERETNAPGSRPLTDVFVHDLVLRSTMLVSIGRGGRRANGSSWSPALSGDGRSVAFVSTASNLVIDDRNESFDVFVTEWRIASMELISRGGRHGSANGESCSPALSADGRFVVFQSDASDLACTSGCDGSGEDINLLWDVFLFDRQQREMKRISADKTGAWMEASGGPALDGSASVIAFSSRHPTDADDRRNDFDLFIVRR